MYMAQESEPLSLMFSCGPQCTLLPLSLFLQERSYATFTGFLLSGSLQNWAQGFEYKYLLGNTWSWHCNVNDSILGTYAMQSYQDSEAAFSSYIATHRERLLYQWWIEAIQ